MNSTVMTRATIAASPTSARYGFCSDGPRSLTTSLSVIDRQHFLLCFGPLVDQRVADAEQHRAQEDTQQSERYRPSQYAKDCQQEGKLRAAREACTEWSEPSATTAYTQPSVKPFTTC